MVRRVDEPAKYGKSVVLTHETGLIDKFVEHGRTFAGNRINAGVYLFSPAIFDRIEQRPTSMEREVLPALAAEEQLYAMPLNGYWMNIKTLPSFLAGTALYLEYLRENRPAELADVRAARRARRVPHRGAGTHRPPPDAAGAPLPATAVRRAPPCRPPAGHALPATRQPPAPRIRHRRAATATKATWWSTRASRWATAA